MLAESREVKSISVVVPCAGLPPTLLSCLDSLRSQTVKVPVEIVIVINGSDAHALEFNQSGVTVVREMKKGAAAARNAGVNAAKGDVLAFIDSDCVASPSWLSAALSTLRSRGCGCIVAGGIARSGATQNWVSLYDSLVFLQQEKYVRACGACVTANLMVYRSVFETVGFFDESFEEAACEDWEWALRARKRRVPIVFDGDALIDHPCMYRLQQLKAKAERLARGQLMLRRKTGQRRPLPGLLDYINGQIRRSYSQSITLTDKLRLACVGVAVAFWTWRATQASLRLKRS